MYLNAKKAKFLKDRGIQLLDRTDYDLAYSDREYWGFPDFHEADWIVCVRREGRIDVGVNARWHFSGSDRICIPACKRAKNNHSFFSLVTQVLNDIDKLKRQRAENQKKKRLQEITEAGNEYAAD